jgi:hypothetical protein
LSRVFILFWGALPHRITTREEEEENKEKKKSRNKKAGLVIV